MKLTTKEINAGWLNNFCKGVIAVAKFRGYTNPESSPLMVFT